MSNEPINLQADFLTFRNQIVEKFGEQYWKQFVLFFDRATAEAGQGLLHSAIADGQFALELSNYSKERGGIPYLLGFLSQLHCDTGQISKAKVYCEHGMKLLDPAENGYEDVRQMFKELKEDIDSEGWKDSMEENTNE